MDSPTQSKTTATMSAVIIRACSECGSKRELDKPCAGCGNSTPPKTHDLGIQSAYYRNPIKNAAWTLVGSPLAARRARKANQED